MNNTLAPVFRSSPTATPLDAACKRFFSEKVILAWILKNVAKEYKDCTIEDIATKYIEGEPEIDTIQMRPDETNARISGLNTEDFSQTEGTVYYDIRFNALAPATEGLIGLIINVEAQKDYYPGYPLIKRGIYYCSRMISAQYGTEFMHSRYDKLKKVYSIWICMNPPKERQNTVNEYTICERNIIGQAHEKLEHYDLISTVIIGLGSDSEQEPGSFLRLLDVIINSQKTSDEKIQILTEEFQIEVNSHMEQEVYDMCNFSEGFYDRGHADGIEKGVEKDRTNSIRTLMETMSLTVEQAMDALRVSAEERPKYQELLKQAK